MLLIFLTSIVVIILAIRNQWSAKDSVLAILCATIVAMAIPVQTNLENEIIYELSANNYIHLKSEIYKSAQYEIYIDKRFRGATKKVIISANVDIPQIVEIQYKRKPGLFNNYFLILANSHKVTYKKHYEIHIPAKLLYLMEGE